MQRLLQVFQAISFYLLNCYKDLLLPVCSRLAREGAVILDLVYCGMLAETLSRLLCHLQQFWVFFRSFLHKFNKNGRDFLSKDNSFLAMGSVELKDMNYFLREETHYYPAFNLFSSSVCRKTHVSKAPNTWCCGVGTSRAGALVSATPPHSPHVLQLPSHSYSGTRASNSFMQGTAELKASKEPFHP